MMRRHAAVLTAFLCLTAAEIPTSPCAVASAAWAAQIAVTRPPIIDAAKLTPACKASPWAKKRRSPSSTPSAHVYKALADLKENLLADAYKSEYEFQTDLYLKVFAPGHDGHFIMYPDALAVFEYRRPNALVSISEDGLGLPVIKLYDDVISSPSTASVVTHINDIQASKYVGDTIFEASYNQDADVAYNSQFFGKAMFASQDTPGYFAVGGRARYIYQGPSTKFSFANGTELTVVNLAAIKGNLTGVTDGASFYQNFCARNSTDVNIVVSTAGARNVSFVLPGYPAPVITTSDSVASGYYLSGGEYEDVAVLALNSFEPKSIAEFQNVTSDFLAGAKADGMTKLIVDLQANGGGCILLGYSFFRQLFPSIEQDGFNRWRENDGFNAMVAITNKEVEGVNPYTEADPNLVSDWVTQFNWRYDLNLTNQPFTSPEDKFAPHVYKKTNYTSLIRWNLNENLTTTNSTFGLGVPVFGYPPLNNLTQPFPSSSIILLYDGFCASSCTIASSMFKHQAGVKSIALGGRPRPGPMQAVGGVKGAQTLQFREVHELAQHYLSLTTDPAQVASLSKYNSLPYQRATTAVLNVRDQILRENVEDGVPAQFVAENADCRLFWTQGMVRDVQEVWKAAARSAFEGAKCAYGEIEQGERRSGNGRIFAEGKSKKGGVRKTRVVKKEKDERDV